MYEKTRRIFSKILIFLFLNNRQETRIPNTFDQHRKFPDSSSIGDDRTRSSSSHDQSLASPRSPNESFTSPFVQHERQIYSMQQTPQYLTQNQNFIEPQPPSSGKNNNNFIMNFNNPIANNTSTKTSSNNIYGQSSDLKQTGSFYNKPAVVDDINKEFQQKIKENQIILYPPKDYSIEDQKRGNFLQAKVTDFRYSLNEHIVGKEAIKQREKKIISALEEEKYVNKSDDDDESSDTSFFREEAEKALKILDEAVEGISLNPIDANRNLFKFKLDEDNVLTNSYENLDHYNDDAQAKIHKKYSNSTENIFKAAASSKNPSFLNNKSTSIASGLNLNEPSIYDANKDKGFIKKNPLHMIEEENMRYL